MGRSLARMFDIKLPLLHLCSNNNPHRPMRRTRLVSKFPHLSIHYSFLEHPLMTAHMQSLFTLCPPPHQASKLSRAVYYTLGFLCLQLIAEFGPEVSMHTQKSVVCWVVAGVFVQKFDMNDEREERILVANLLPG